MPHILSWLLTRKGEKILFVTIDNKLLFHYRITRICKDSNIIRSAVVKVQNYMELVQKSFTNIFINSKFTYLPLTCMFFFLSEYKKRTNIPLTSSFILIFSYFVILCWFFLLYLIEMLLHRQKLYYGKSIFFMMYFFFGQPKNKDQNPRCTRMEIAKGVKV